MSDTDDSGLDDELFPACNAVAHAGTRHTDEYGVTYICDLVDLDDGPTYAWVLLDRPQDHQPGR